MPWYPQLVQTLLPWYPQLVQTLLPWYPQTLLSVEHSKDSDIGNQDHYRPGKEPVLLIGNKPKKFNFVNQTVSRQVRVGGAQD